MDIRQLKYFTTLVDEQTYTKAASALHTSQPSLSAAIKKLEEEVGLILINLSKRQLESTREDQIFYQESGNVVHLYEHVSVEMDRVKQQGPLELSIGLIESSMFFIPDILTECKQEFLEVRIS